MSQTVFATPFIGREEELARLSGVLERARGGEARAVLVAGDAGVGKTRVLNEIAVRAARAGMTVLTGHCVDLGDVGLPYLPFTEILGLLAADGRFAAVLAAHPRGRPAARRGRAGRAGRRGSPARSDAGGGRLRLLEGMAALFADLSEVTPLLLVLEDLHWADQSSRDLLRFLLSRGFLQRPTGGGPGHRLAVLASYRADDLHRRHPLRPLLAELVRLPAVERLELRPLADAEVARLVRALRRPSAAGRHGAPDRGARRGQRLLRGGAAWRARDAEAGGVPERAGRPAADPVRAAPRHRPAGAAHRRRRRPARRARPAAGRRGTARGGAGVGSAGGGRPQAAGRRGDDGTYAFRHALAREAVYADLLPGERVAAARRVRPAAGRSRPPRPRPRRNAPTTTARAMTWREALAASLEAADHAQRVGAPAEELRHLEAVLDLWEAVPAAARPSGEGGDRVTLMLRASAAAAHAGEAHRAVSLTRAALAGVGQDADSELAARVRYTLAGTLMGVDSLTAAFAYSSEALAMIPAEPPSPTWVWAAATHVLAARQVGDVATALRVARQALGVAERLGLTDARADLLVSLANLEGGGRRSPEGRARLKEARELARRGGNAPWRCAPCSPWPSGPTRPGSRTECLPWLAEGLDRARRAGPAVLAVPAGDALSAAAGALHPGPLGRVPAHGGRRPGGAARRRAASRSAPRCTSPSRAASAAPSSGPGPCSRGASTGWRRSSRASC